MTSSFAPFGRSGLVTQGGYPERDGAVVVVVVVGHGQAYYEVWMMSDDDVDNVSNVVVYDVVEKQRYVNLCCRL